MARRTPDPRQVRPPARPRAERFDLNPLVIHVNYLINLASLDPVIRAKSIAAFRGELERADGHRRRVPGPAPGQLPRASTVDEGIAAFALGLREAAEGLPAHNVTVLLENTAGAGCHIGSRFEELRSIRDSPANLPTCRSVTASTPATCWRPASTSPRPTACDETVRQAERDPGAGQRARDPRQRFRKFPLGSHVDRHANIGEGYIGKTGSAASWRIRSCGRSLSSWKRPWTRKATTAAIWKH